MSRDCGGQANLIFPVKFSNTKDKTLLFLSRLFFV